MEETRRWWSIVAAAAILAVLVAFISGCQKSASVSEVGVTDAEIKIGSIWPMSGPNADYGLIRYGMMMYFNEVNEAGGVNGRKITVQVEDDAANRVTHVAAAKKLISLDKVFALVGGVVSSAVVAALPTAIDNKVPYVVIQAAAHNITDPLNRYVFRTCQDIWAHADGIAQFAKQKGYKTLAVMYSSDDYGKEGLAGAQKAAAKYGLQIVGEEVHNFGDKDFTPALLKVKDAKPDALAVFSYANEIATIARQRYELGIAAPIITSASGDSPLFPKLVSKEALEGFTTVTLVKDLTDSATFATYRQKFERWYPNIAALPNQPEPNSISGYGGAAIFVEALKKVGKDVTREKLIDAMESIKDFDTGVHPGKVSYSSTDHSGNNAVALYTYGKEYQKQMVQLAR